MWVYTPLGCTMIDTAVDSANTSPGHRERRAPPVGLAHSLAVRHEVMARQRYPRPLLRPRRPAPRIVGHFSVGEFGVDIVAFVGPLVPLRLPLGDGGGGEDDRQYAEREQ